MSTPFDRLQDNQRDKYNALHALYQTIKYGDPDFAIRISNEMSKIDGKNPYSRI